MAEYIWKPSLMRRVFVLPEAIADKHLKMAGSVQLKVLLWVSRHGGSFDAEACAKAVGVSAPDCMDALQYWVAAGVLLSDGSEPMPEPTASEKPPAPVAPPRAVTVPKVNKPQMTDVVRRQKKDGEFRGLLTEVSVRMGRPLSNGDAETLLYLYDTAGLPASVLLMVVGYAAQAERLNMRYIEKVALDWADRGIMTIAAVEEHLCYLERCDQAAIRVQTVCELSKPLSTAAALRLAEKWVFQWQVTDEVLREAYVVCREKTGKFESRYVDRVLENWHEQGVTTADEAANAQGKKRAVDTGEKSEYEKMVEQYVPVYKKKG